jgi:oligoendopeptidase F
MPPLEFAEVASMGMESMAMEHFAKVYPAEEARRARLQSLEGMITTFAWVAVIDGFQQWLYTDGAEANAQERRAYWCSLHGRFSGKVNWNGLQAERDSLWQRQLHIYHVPFYYIEYAQAQMGALQLWIRYRKEPEAAVADYRKALSLGGSRKLPELFEAAGLVYDPRGEGLGEWMEEVEREWKKALPA